MNYRITLAYDGTGYSGWQMQRGHVTIQAALEDALAKLAGQRVITHAAGRTDAGVHAEGQVASFKLAREWSGADLIRALNGNLPRDIRTTEATLAPDAFHPRASARSKTYRYRIFTAAVMSPFWLRYAWHHPHPLDLELINRELASFLGTHDFTGFTVTACTTKTRIRTVTEARTESDGALLTFYFSGDGFLRYQVRTMVGALMQLGRKQLQPPSIAELIARRNRMLIGADAPALGLTLLKVEY